MLSAETAEKQYPGMKQQRSPALSVAVTLLVLFSLCSLAVPLLPGHSQVPRAIVIASAVFGIAGLVAAVGLSMDRRWAFWLVVVVSSLNAVSAASGITRAPTLLLQILCIAITVGSIAVLALALRPSIRRALRSTAGS